MKTKNIITSIMLLTLFLFVGCENNFEETNSKSYAPQNVNPGTLLPTAINSMTNGIISRSFYINNELMQYTSINNTVDQVSWYYINDGNSEASWGHYYPLQDIMDIARIAEANNYPNYLAIALTLKSYLFQNITDVFINVPYTEALQAEEKILQPKFDSQEDIYKGILEDLEKANSLINIDEGLAFGGDILYQGDMLKWKKLINSLRIRYYMRLSKRSEINSGQKINEILSNPSEYPIFEGNEDSAVLRYSGEQPFVNPFYNSNPLQFELHNMSTTFTDYLKITNDTRITAFAQPIDGATGGIDSLYEGLESGLAFSEVSGNDGSKSIVNFRFKSATEPGLIMTYYELQFLLAEASYKTMIEGDTEEYYFSGIESNFDYWDVSISEGFLDGPKIKYNNTLEQIMTQKWVALFFCGMESWYDYRRTGFPILHVGIGHSNNGKVPVRFPYPLKVQSLNKANYESAVLELGGDNMNIKGWWEKD